MLVEHEGNYDFGMDALLTVCSWNANGIMEHERNYEFGMDALVTVCFWNTDGIMNLAWML